MFPLYIYSVYRAHYTPISRHSKKELMQSVEQAVHDFVRAPFGVDKTPFKCLSHLCSTIDLIALDIDLIHFRTNSTNIVWAERTRLTKYTLSEKCVPRNGIFFRVARRFTSDSQPFPRPGVGRMHGSFSSTADKPRQ